jgi:hypothetical protein
MIFSVVSHMLPSYVMPWPMWMTSSDCKLLSADQRGLKLQYNNSVMRIKNDLHVLSKDTMLNDNLEMLQQWSLAND